MGATICLKTEFASLLEQNAGKSRCQSTPGHRGIRMSCDTWMYIQLCCCGVHMYIYTEMSVVTEKNFIWKIKIYPTDSSMKNKLCQFIYFLNVLKSSIITNVKSPPKTNQFTNQWCVNAFHFKTKPLLNRKVNQNNCKKKKKLVPFIIWVSFQFFQHKWNYWPQFFIKVI